MNTCKKAVSDCKCTGIKKHVAPIYGGVRAMMLHGTVA